MPDAAPRTLTRAIRAELTKLLTLRASMGIALATVLVTIAASWALTSLIDAALRAGRPEETAGLEPASAFLVILHYGQIGVILLAAWVMHQEAEPGSLRTTLVSTPQRGAVFAAKGIVTAVVVAIVAALSAFGSAGARCLVIDCSAPGGPDVSQLLGVVACWTLIALLTLALAVMLRSGLAAMGLMLALSLAVSVALMNMTPLARFLPDQAGSQLWQPTPVPAGDLDPLTGGLVLLAWVAAALAAAFVAFRRHGIRH